MVVACRAVVRTGWRSASRGRIESDLARPRDNHRRERRQRVIPSPLPAGLFPPTCDERVRWRNRSARRRLIGWCPRDGCLHRGAGVSRRTPRRHRHGRLTPSVRTDLVMRPRPRRATTGHARRNEILRHSESGVPRVEKRSTRARTCREHWLNGVQPVAHRRDDARHRPVLAPPALTKSPSFPSVPSAFSVVHPLTRTSPRRTPRGRTAPDRPASPPPPRTSRGCR